MLLFFWIVASEKHVIHLNQDCCEVVAKWLQNCLSHHPPLMSVVLTLKIQEITWGAAQIIVQYVAPHFHHYCLIDELQVVPHCHHYCLFQIVQNWHWHELQFSNHRAMYVCPIFLFFISCFELVAALLFFCGKSLDLGCQVGCPMIVQHLKFVVDFVSMCSTFILISCTSFVVHGRVLYLQFAKIQHPYLCLLLLQRRKSHIHIRKRVEFQIWLLWALLSLSRSLRNWNNFCSSFCLFKACRKPLISGVMI